LVTIIFSSLELHDIQTKPFGISLRGTLPHAPATLAVHLSHANLENGSDCADHSGAKGVLNDDYCDCADGSGEDSKNYTTHLPLYFLARFQNLHHINKNT
jgi:hypothetical protein